MNKLNRRQFLGTSAFGIGGAIVASQIPFGLQSCATAHAVNLPIGFQTWTLREELAKDFPGTLKMMAGLGYQSLEMCSPPGYVDSGFAPLMKYSAKEMRKIIEDAGLILMSTHYGMDELRQHLDERILFATESGQKQMIVSSVGLPETATMNDWLKAADELSQMGEKTKKAGIQLGYHNHHTEFGKIDGALIYDALMNQLNPETVKMQFQVAVISIGYKASTYFTRYPGRFISAHLADWSSVTQKEAPIGQGIVDWKEFFDTLNTGGVKNIFVEMQPDTFKDSALYLKSL
jgi:sugar phosphate isomerase/epimerase